jgi:hypothetical protein
MVMVVMVMVVMVMVVMVVESGQLHVQVVSLPV